MATKIGNRTYRLDSPVYIIGSSAITGTKEADGPFKKYIKRVAADDTMGEDSFEKAERRKEEGSAQGIHPRGNFRRRACQPSEGHRR